MKFDKNIEPILAKTNNRFTLFPIKYEDIYSLYQKSLASFWTPSEIDFSQDKNDFQKLTKDEQYFIKNVLAFFAGSDGIVNENLAINFHNEIEIPEVRALYTVQMCIESIHSETYSIMIETLVNEGKDDLFNAIEKIPAVKRKAEWALKYITNGNFAERLLAFTIVEGIFFSGSFCSIFWLKTKGIMPGLCMANQFISRDESMHCLTGVTLYKKLLQKLPENKVKEIFKEAYEIEAEFITESLPVSLIGMNSDLMKTYIKYVVDYWLLLLGYTKMYNVKNPFQFMEYISIENQTNFFEKRVSEYSKAGILTKKEDTQFSLDADF